MQSRYMFPILLFCHCFFNDAVCFLLISRWFVLFPRTKSTNDDDDDDDDFINAAKRFIYLLYIANRICNNVCYMSLRERKSLTAVWKMLYSFCYIFPRIVHAAEVIVCCYCCGCRRPRRQRQPRRHHHILNVSLSHWIADSGVPLYSALNNVSYWE